jgi:hypothetical protein
VLLEEEASADVDEEKEDMDDDDAVQVWKWAGGFGANGRVIVHPPNDKMPWTTGPQYAQGIQ